MSNHKTSPTTAEMPIDQNIRRVLDWDISKQPKVEPSSESESILRVEGLKMYFPVTKGLLKRQVGSVKAVDDVSFRVKAGTTVGIVLHPPGRDAGYRGRIRFRQVHHRQLRDAQCGHHRREDVL